jgi:hypothetical protein
MIEAQERAQRLEDELKSDSVSETDDNKKEIEMPGETEVEPESVAATLEQDKVNLR